MLLARLVTGRYGYLPNNERPPVATAAETRGWFSRFIAAIFLKKNAG